MSIDVQRERSVLDPQHHHPDGQYFGGLFNHNWTASAPCRRRPGLEPLITLSMPVTRRRRRPATGTVTQTMVGGSQPNRLSVRAEAGPAASSVVATAGSYAITGVTTTATIKRTLACRCWQL
jgi:hypothetical protein